MSRVDACRLVSHPPITRLRFMEYPDYEARWQRHDQDHGDDKELFHLLKIKQNPDFSGFAHMPGQKDASPKIPGRGLKGLS